MSQAFIREGDDQSLEDIAPSLTALIVFLTRENNGIQASERSCFTNQEGKQIHVMSNGLSYTRSDQGKWQIV